MMQSLMRRSISKIADHDDDDHHHHHHDRNDNVGDYDEEEKEQEEKMKILKKDWFDCYIFYVLTI